MEKLLSEMAIGELQLNLKNLANSSKQAIDLIDRNLFERSADIRWWATDKPFWEALAAQSAEAYDDASARLKVINGSYTMYRNLVLADHNGDIVACSKLELRNELRKINVSDQEWFQSGMRTAKSTDYAVQDVQDSNLERSKNRSLIYAGGVRADGVRQGEAIGVLGILFDWDTEAQTILNTCLPQDSNGEVLTGSAAFYTNAQHEIIETTDEERFPVGMVPPLPLEHKQIANGESLSWPLRIRWSSLSDRQRPHQGLPRIRRPWLESAHPSPPRLIAREALTSKGPWCRPWAFCITASQRFSSGQVSGWTGQAQTQAMACERLPAAKTFDGTLGALRLGDHQFLSDARRQRWPL